jgi:hypothetical protein
MRRLLPREARTPIMGQLLLSLVFVLMAFGFFIAGKDYLAVGLLLVAFLVVGGAKRAR